MFVRNRCHGTLENDTGCPRGKIINFNVRNIKKKSGGKKNIRLKSSPKMERGNSIPNKI